MSTIPQPQNNRVVSFGNRIFAAFALEHNVHCIPVDEVSTMHFPVDLLRNSTARLAFRSFVEAFHLLLTVMLTQGPDGLPLSSVEYLSLPGLICFHRQKSKDSFSFTTYYERYSTEP